MMAFRIQYTTRAAIRRAGDTEDAGWSNVPGLWEAEQVAKTEASDLESVSEGRFVYRVIGFELVRAA